MEEFESVELGEIYPVEVLYPGIVFRVVEPPNGEDHLRRTFVCGRKPGQSFYLEELGSGKHCYVKSGTLVQVLAIPEVGTSDMRRQSLEGEELDQRIRDLQRQLARLSTLGPMELALQMEGHRIELLLSAESVPSKVEIRASGSRPSPVVIDVVFREVTEEDD